MFDQDENLRNAILKQKARLADIELRLNHAPVRLVRWGMASKVSPNGGQRTQEERIHLQEVIADLERELLLQQYHRSRNDPFALAAIEQKLSERGTPMRRPEGYATVIETPSSPVKTSADRGNDVAQTKLKPRRPPPWRELDSRKMRISRLKAQKMGISSRNICVAMDEIVEHASTSTREALKPLESWTERAGGKRMWVELYDDPRTRNVVKKYINELPAALQRRS